MTRPSVLVTGAAGYVGRLTIDALLARADELDRIVALDIVEASQGDRGGAVEHVVGDVSETDLVALMRLHAIDTVVHLASIVRAPPDAPPDLAHRVDVLGTKNVLEACVAAGVRKLIVTTSGAAYGYYADNPGWIDEDDPLRGNENFPYAHHKKLVEAMLATCRRENPGLSQMVLRPGTIIGEGTRSPVTDLFEARVILGVWGSRSPFVFIWDQDLVQVILLGVLEDGQGVYNLAGDGVLTAREIARRLHKPYVSLPAPALQAGLWALHALGRTFHGPEQVAFLRYRPVLSNRRLKEDLGFQPVDSSTAFGKWADARASERRARP